MKFDHEIAGKGGGRHFVLFFIFWSLISLQKLHCQSIIEGFKSKPTKEAVIPFEYTNNFIVIKLVLNGILPLKFIVDTGAQHTLITKKEIATILNLKSRREFKVMGADLKRELVANLVTGMEVQIENVNRKHLAMLVLDEDYFLFEEMTGSQIHGILGVNFFRNYVMEFDYLRKVIRLKDPSNFKNPGKKYQEFDLTVKTGKPYVIFPTEIEQGTNPLNLKYLIDSGAALSILINPATQDSILMPQNIIPGNVGNGLGGSIDGFIGRTSKLKIGSEVMTDIPTYFHDIETDSILAFDNRNGLIGNLVLERFHVIINFTKEKLYLRPNRNHKKKFKFDKSGISVIASGINFNQYIIQNVIKGSPSDLAGLKTGDKIMSINYLPYWLTSLDGIIKKLKKKEGKRIRLRVQDQFGKKTVKFKLKKLL